MGYAKGQRATGPNGEVVVFDGTQWVEAAPQTGGMQVFGNPDPYKASDEARKARRDRLDMAKDNIDIGNAPLERARLAADVEKARLEVEKAKKDLTEPSKVGDAKSDQKFANLRALETQLARVEQLYKAGPGATSGLSALGDYLPTPGNRQFDSAAAGLSEIGMGAFRTPGVGAQSDTELRAFIDANRPSAGDYDPQIEEKLRNLRTRLNATYQQMGLPLSQSTLGNDQHPIAGATHQGGGPQINLPTGTGGLPGSGMGGGGDTSGFLPRQSINLGGLEVRRGGFSSSGDTSGTITDDSYFLTPDAARRMDMAIATAKGPQDVAAAYKAVTGYNPDAGIIDSMMKAYRSGQSTAGVPADPAYEDAINIQVATQAQDDRDRAAFVDMQNKRNTLGGAVDTFGRGAANAFSLGGADKLAALMGDGSYQDNLYMQKLQNAADANANPMADFAGQTAGVIGATGGIGMLGRAATRSIPKLGGRLLGGGKAAAFGRNVAADASYGGAYNAANGENPLTGAAAAAAGSVVGQGVGRGIGKVMTGGGSMAAKVLRAKGVPLTVGQAVSDSGIIGRSIKGIEDRMAGFPVIGDIVNARRMEGLSGFNNAAFNEGVAPIGGSINRVGPAGVEDAFALGSNAYDNAVKGVDLPLTPQFGADLGNAMAKGQNLPGQMADEFAWTMQNRVQPEINAGRMTGEGYQSIMQGLRRDRGAMKGQPRGLDFADSVRGVEGVTTDFMRNNGGANVVSGLNTADKAWRNIKVLQDAVDKAKNAEELFTPAQINQAASASAKKFGGSHGTTNRPFYALGQAAQKVLPSKIPDSGTAGRLALMALPATMGGTGAGLGYASGDAQGGAATGIGAGMALAALGTKAGQKLLVKAIMDRPASVRSIGRKIRKGKGLLGSAAVPLFLPSGE